MQSISYHNVIGNGVGKPGSVTVNLPGCYSTPPYLCVHTEYIAGENDILACFQSLLANTQLYFVEWLRPQRYAGQYTIDLVYDLVYN